MCQQRILLVWCSTQPSLTYQFYLVLPLTKQKPLLSSLGSHCLVVALSKFAIYRSYSSQLLLTSEDCMREFTRASYLGTFFFFFSIFFFFFFLRKFSSAEAITRHSFHNSAQSPLDCLVGKISSNPLLI